MSPRSKLGLALYHALTVVCLGSPSLAEKYPIVDTGQQRCHDNSLEISYPKAGEPFFGQDTQYQGHQPSYRDNGNGTITDLVTGLMWQKDPGAKMTFYEAVAVAESRFTPQPFLPATDFFVSVGKAARFCWPPSPNSNNWPTTNLFQTNPISIHHPQ